MRRPEAEEGVVIAHFGVAVAVRRHDGRIERHPVRRRSSYVVGDRVRLDGRRLEVVPGRGVLRRRDAHGRVRAVAANLDLLGIVIAPLPATPTGFLDRATVAARAAGIEPFLVVNKADLPGAPALLEASASTHACVEPRLLVSATTGEGLGALRRLFAASGARGAFIGTSGVGKSSLLNALVPDLELAVAAIGEASGLGRHVTSTATLHALPDGGELIDTPGFRDFGPVAVSSRELAAFFPGFEQALREGCRFRDCLHRSEPGCAVLDAEASARLAPGRHAAYLDLLAELEAAEQDARR